MNEDEIEMTVWDGEGRIVHRSGGRRSTSNIAEVERLVAAIEAGAPACTASLVVRSESDA